ncbi:hypothetical protein L6452_14059 [Arctium lappa]|uniref:Uncharacterized protein n=1 Tax=Arctium lappa TaxID=4217 RepID=A0ACB9CJT9_ARCLA|nr:hypothetical protein L6452_14059 [Arctium lappa]
MKIVGDELQRLLRVAPTTKLGAAHGVNTGLSKAGSRCLIGLFLSLMHCLGAGKPNSFIFLVQYVWMPVYAEWRPDLQSLKATRKESMGETHLTNEFYHKSMYLDVHPYAQHPEGPTHLKTTSQALLQMAEV